MPEIELSHGTIHYRDQGSGPVIVLIHGLLVNGTVWDRAIPNCPTAPAASSPIFPWAHIGLRWPGTPICRR